MRSLILVVLAAVAWTADLDALAEQRHQEAVAKQEAAAAEQRADAERERKAKDVQPPRWVIPKGKPGQVPPAWAQGDWMMGGASLVVGARTVGVDGQPPMEIAGVTMGGDWCVLALRMVTLSGPARLVLIQRDGAVLVGSSFEPQGKPDAVEQWQELKPASAPAGTGSTK